MSEDQSGLSNLRRQWEKRAASQQADLSGVLFQGLPKEINLAIHKWHRNILRDKLLELIPANGRLLDLGCGYGRLSGEIARYRPDVHSIGVDVSFNYCQLFHRNMDAAVVCAPIQCLPFKPESFDALLGVTTLMYVSPEYHEEVITEAIGLLRPGGHALFFDPGTLFLSFSGKLFPGKRKQGSGGVGVTKRHYKTLGKGAGCRVLECSGGSFLTLAFPLAIFSRPLPRLQNAMLRYAVALDSANTVGACWDFHHWILLEKTGQAAS